MTRFSILPSAFSFIETWLVRFFLFLAALAIGPWLLLIVYDIFLFLIRTTMYDVPVIGGRARNRPRPRAPSLAERPSGRPRGFSVSLPGLSTSQENAEEVSEGLKQRINKQNRAGNTGDVLIDE